MTNMDIPKLPVKLVFSKDIHTYTGFSLRWIYTLEQRGQFPKRIRLGPVASVGTPKKWQNGKTSGKTLTKLNDFS